MAEPAANNPWRIGVDTGGTFTDLVLSRDGRLTTEKLASTPENPALALLEGLQLLLGDEVAQAVGRVPGRRHLALQRLVLGLAAQGLKIARVVGPVRSVETEFYFTLLRLLISSPIRQPEKIVRPRPTKNMFVPVKNEIK